MTLAHARSTSPAPGSGVAAPSHRHGGGLAAGLVVLVGVLAVVAFVSVTLGTRDVGLATIWKAFTDFDPDNTSETVIRELRVPRTLVGLVAGMSLGLAGAILQGVNHGLSTGALFLLVGFLYERRHTRDIAEFGGIAKRMPIYAAFFVFVTMSSIALPLTNGFVGEFLIFGGSFKEGVQSSILPRPDGAISWRTVVLVCTGVATLGIVLGAVYMLSMVRRVFFGEVTKHANELLKDLTLRERVIVGILSAFILWIGVAPAGWLKLSEATVHAMVQPIRPQIQQVRSPADYQRELRTAARPVVPAVAP